MVKEKEIFRQYLHSHGLKHTDQRDAILESFLRSEEHLSAEDLYHLIRKKHPRIGFSTVYRTLKLLCGCSLARETRLRDGLTRFEHSYNHPHHDHIICVRCGQATEFVEPGIEALQDQVAKRYNFAIQDHRMEIFGICEKCR
ncbi:MAG: transcriptional repressor [Armatimonadetes bacterium]|nr:transcriptional repressor [Armatimonadota bacterium]